MPAYRNHIVARYVIDPVLDFLYPPICFHCAVSIRRDQYLCDHCLASLTPIEINSRPHTKLRIRMVHDGSVLRDVYALYQFEGGGVLQSIVHELKYQQKTKIGIDMGQKLGKMLKKHFAVDQSWTLVPVPLHPAKERERGYNQSHYISEGVRSVTGAEISASLVIRVRRTKSQTKLSYKERMENVANAFELLPNRTFRDGQQIALVDDLITTGATMKEVARVFPAMVHVYGFSVAWTDIE